VSRRVKLPTQEMGVVTLLTIRQRDGKWEDEWEPLRESPFGALLSVITNDAFDHALHGWSKPMVQSLGIPPDGALHKLPKEARECHRRAVCPLYDVNCVPFSKRMPWCFEPGGIADEKVRKAVARAIEKWHAGVYLVVIVEY
jgi:hypothetical protein